MEIIAKFISSLILFYSLHRILKIFIKDNNTIYFILHAIYNLASLLLIIPDILSAIFDPLKCYIEWSTNIPMITLMSFHSYHLLIEPKLTLDEIFHHILFCFIFPPILISLTHYNMTNVVLFFTIGIPGLVMYTLLTLVKFNIVKKQTEKTISKLLYMWIRMPGCIIMATFLQLHIHYCERHNTTFNQYFSLLCSFALCWNGIYYADKYSLSQYKYSLQQ
ncbi:unnamed protein product [marine sediment metagenome]|uniref:TLC domain-containing protein n=1 Tax=marine sediment metagenome TaxID=412755 RepID=X1EHV4_9ZZZZ